MSRRESREGCRPLFMSPARRCASCSPPRPQPAPNIPARAPRCCFNGVPVAAAEIRRVRMIAEPAIQEQKKVRSARHRFSGARADGAARCARGSTTGAMSAAVQRCASAACQWQHARRRADAAAVAACSADMQAWRCVIQVRFSAFVYVRRRAQIY